MHCGCFCQILSENHVASTEALSYLHFKFVRINPRKLLLTTKIAILKQANHTASDWFWIHDFWFLCCCFLYSFLRGKTNPAQKDLLIRDQTMILTYFILKRFRGLFYHFFFAKYWPVFLHIHVKSIQNLSPHFEENKWNFDLKTL